MATVENGDGRLPAQADRETQASGQSESGVPGGEATRGPSREQGRRPRGPRDFLFLGAIAIALMASGVSLGVVHKALRLQSEWERLQRAAADPANTRHYAWANARLLGAQSYRPGEITIVFGGAYGAAWEMLAALQREGVYNRCLPGQTTTQLLLRLEQDVLALQPEAMVFLPPLNGARDPERTLLHTRLIGELASAQGIRTALATIPPIPAEADTIPGGYLGGMRAINRGLAELAREKQWPLLDLYAPLAGGDFYLAPEFSEDQMWPNTRGYRRATDMLATFLDRWKPIGAPRFDPPELLGSGEPVPGGAGTSGDFGQESLRYAESAGPGQESPR